MNLFGLRALRWGCRPSLAAAAVAGGAMLFLVRSTALSSEHLPAEQGPQRIAIVISMDLEPYQQAVAGFKEALAEAKIELPLSTYCLNKGPAQDARIGAEISSNPWGLVLCVGTEATRFVQTLATRAPILFCVVSDPKGEGIVTDRHLETWVAGVATDIPVSVQFQKLKEALPDAKKIAVVYDEKSSAELIKQAAAEAKVHGLELLAIPVKAQAEVPAAFTILRNKVDALWAIVDRTVYSSESARFILTFVLRNKLPFMAYSPQYVEAGALFALSCEYEDLGRQAGEMAARLLRTKELPTPLVVPPRKYLLSVNLRVMKIIGCQLPYYFLSQADTVFE